MSNPLFDLSPYQSEAPQTKRAGWKDATGIDPAWDEKDLGTNDKQPDNDAPTEWRSAAEFTLMLPSGQTVEVKFVPSLVGERRMHQLDFTGPVSATGFKSHFVLALEAEEFPHPSDYALAYVEELLVQLAQKPHQGKKTSLTRDHLGAEAPQGGTTDNDNSKHEPAMRENQTPDSSHVPIEVVEELSPEEVVDRQRLELTVEQAFYQAGCALRELRDRRLYRDTHPDNFIGYCRDRFDKTKQAVNYLIAAAGVYENLLQQTTTNCCRHSRAMLPTNESQCRPLTKLEPDEQHQVWSEAIEIAGGKAPSARIVKDAVLRHQGVVDRLKQKNPTPQPFALGNVIEIKAASGSPLRPFNGMWGIIERVCSFSYTVRLGISRDTQQCKEEELTRIDDEYTADIKAVVGRISWLVQNFELESVEYDILANLQRSKCFTPTQLQLLEWLEHKHLAA